MISKLTAGLNAIPEAMQQRLRSSGVAVIKIGAAIDFMSDSEILELHNDVVRSQLELAANWRPTQITDGHRQIKFDQTFGQWSTEGMFCVVSLAQA